MSTPSITTDPTHKSDLTTEQPSAAVQDSRHINPWIDDPSIPEPLSVSPSRYRSGKPQANGTKRITTQSGSPPRKKTKGKTSGKKWKKKYSLIK